MNQWKRPIAILMALILLFSSTVYATTTNEGFAENSDPGVSVTETAITGEVTRVREEESLRTTNSETYLLSDGTYECVVYAEDKYYQDENSALKRIDNSIVPESSSEISTNAVGAVTAYKNAANIFDARFSTGGTPEVSLTYGGSSLSFSPVQAVTQGNVSLMAQSSALSVGRVQNETLAQLTSTGSNTATYTNAFPNADLVYVLENSLLKEYIILRSAAASNTYSFLFQMDGVTLQTTGRNPAFVDTEGTTVFALADLFAIDANGKPTDALTYSLQSTGKRDEIIITVTLDEAYLEAPERAFPVIIDPSTMISSVETADTCVCSAFPTTNYYTSSYLRTGKDTDFGVRRSYIKFNLPNTWPTNFTIQSAYLEVEMLSGVTPNLYASRCIGSWSSSTLTWNNKPGYASTGGSNKALAQGNGWYSMIVTNIVKAWMIDLLPNYGFVLMDGVENNTNQWTTFYSSDAVSPHKPELHITYTLPDYVFTNYYDNSFTSALAWRIPSAVNAVNKAYSDCFSTTFGATGSAIYRSDLTSECTLGTNTPCSNACSPHHKNVYGIYTQLVQESRDSNEKIVFWTDRNKRTYCTHQSGNCVPYEEIGEEVLAVVHDYSNVIHMMNMLSYTGSYDEYEACMAIILLHETAHTFGMKDCYDIEPHWSAGYQCVMEQYQTNNSVESVAEDYYEAIVSGVRPAFCDTCRGVLVAKIP